MLAYDNQGGDVGNGPYSVDHDEADGFFYLTLHGTRTGKSYPLGKTAYRTARKLNEEHADPTTVQPAPEPPKAAEPKAKPAKAAKRVNAPKAKASKPAKPAEAPKAEKPKSAHRATHSTVTFTGTREEWLNAFTAAARPVFAARGHAIPEKVHVSVGFMFRSAKAIGQAWRPEASADGVSQIFVSPVLGGEDSSRIAGVLTHELCHAVTPGDKHGKLFGACARAVGLEGKLTATTEGEAWHEWADPILASLGPCPHAAIDPGASGIKKQKTRLLKGICEDCGFTARLTAKWVNKAEDGLQCPDRLCGGEFKCVVEGEEEGEEG